MGYSATIFDMQCGDPCDQSTINYIFENNIVLGFSNPAYNDGQTPGTFYGTFPTLQVFITTIIIFIIIIMIIR
jgi:hypothetical protein